MTLRPANGGTHLVRGSQRTHQLPKEVLSDLYAPHPDEVVVEGKAGDVFIFNGHWWHAGGANTTDKPRRALLVHYIRSDQPLRLDPKTALSREAQARMNPDEREILGLND
ncbi:MAG: phytanoyl-CoA dioxygenase family protein [Chloroflexota bacterium]